MQERCASRWLLVTSQPSFQRLMQAGAWSVAGATIIEALIVIVFVRYGYDSHAYWLAWRGPMYGLPPNAQDAYLYSPAFAQLIWPIAVLPWPAFAVAFSVVLLGCLGWLLKPLPARWALPLGLAGMSEVAAGNVYLIMAVAAALGCRRPAFWAFVALTKITPCVGPVWFMTRREWKPASLSIIVTLGITGLSWAIMPGAWNSWVEFLLHHVSDSTGAVGAQFLPPLVLRMPVGLALLAWGAKTNRRWVIPVAMVLCTPVIGFGSFATLLALPRVCSRCAPSGRSTRRRA